MTNHTIPSISTIIGSPIHTKSSGSLLKRRPAHCVASPVFILQHTQEPEAVPIPQPTHPEHLIQQSARQVNFVCIVLSAVVSAFKIILLLNCASHLPHNMNTLLLPLTLQVAQDNHAPKLAHKVKDLKVVLFSEGQCLGFSQTAGMT